MEDNLLLAPGADMWPKQGSPKKSFRLQSAMCCSFTSIQLPSIFLFFFFSSVLTSAHVMLGLTSILSVTFFVIQTLYSSVAADGC